MSVDGAAARAHQRTRRPRPLGTTPPAASARRGGRCRRSRARPPATDRAGQARRAGRRSATGSLAVAASTTSTVASTVTASGSRPPCSTWRPHVVARDAPAAASVGLDHDHDVGLRRPPRRPPSGVVASTTTSGCPCGDRGVIDGPRTLKNAAVEVDVVDLVAVEVAAASGASRMTASSSQLSQSRRTDLDGVGRLGVQLGERRRPACGRSRSASAWPLETVGHQPARPALTRSSVAMFFDDVERLGVGRVGDGNEADAVGERGDGGQGQHRVEPATEALGAARLEAEGVVHGDEVEAAGFGQPHLLGEVAGGEEPRRVDVLRSPGRGMPARAAIEPDAEPKLATPHGSHLGSDRRRSQKPTNRVGFPPTGAPRGQSAAGSAWATS